MAAVKSDIDMYLNIIVKTLGTEGANKELKQKLTKGFQGARKENLLLNQALGKMSTSFDSFRGIMQLGIEDFRNIANGQIKFNSLGARTAVRLRKMTHGFRGFKMALLGVMFAGQNLNRSMMKMLQPAMEARNINEKWARGLRDLFLPVIKALEPAIKSMTKWMKELSPGVKMVIGGFVVFTAIVGKVLFLIGSFGLAIGSLIMLLPSSRNKVIELAGAMAAYTAATVAATGATIALNVATGGIGSVLKGGQGVLQTTTKLFHGSGLHAAVKSTTAEVIKFNQRFLKTNKVLKFTSKTVKGAEKAFKGSGLHAAIKDTDTELKKFTVDVLSFDFVMGNSAKKMPWYTSLWEKIVKVWEGGVTAIDNLITKVKELLGLEEKPPTPTIAGPGDVVHTPTGGVSTAFPEQYKTPIAGIDYWLPQVARIQTEAFAAGAAAAMAFRTGTPFTQEQGTYVPPQARPPSISIPEPTAPPVGLMGGFTGVRGGVAGAGVSTAFPEQYGAGSVFNVQVYVDGNEVTSRFNSNIVDETKFMGGL